MFEPVNERAERAGYRDAMEARSAALGVHERREAAAGDDTARSCAGDCTHGRTVAAPHPIGALFGRRLRGGLKELHGAGRQLWAPVTLLYVANTSARRSTMYTEAVVSGRCIRPPRGGSAVCCWVFGTRPAHETRGCPPPGSPRGGVSRGKTDDPGIAAGEEGAQSRFPSRALGSARASKNEVGVPGMPRLKPMTRAERPGRPAPLALLDAM